MSLSEQGDILIRELFAGDMTPERHRELEDWLRQDKANARLLAEFAVVERLLFTEQKKLDASAILALLLEAEENAEPMLVVLPEAKPDHAHAHGDAVSYRQVFSLVSYFAAKSLREKAGFVAGIAAAFVLAAVLAIVMIGGPNDDPTGNEVVIADPIPVDLVPDAAIAIATVTAQQDAQWQAVSGSVLPSVGTGLRPGERLTLTAGFAEITTGRGAVLVIEAPSVVEMTHQQNSVVLHSGRLVGICETESSKGLLVRTPHMDIIDLGTRFGVDASRPDSTEVHVFDGEVQVASPDDQAEVTEQILSAGQAIAARDEGRVFEPIQEDVQRFTAVQHAQFVSIRPKSKIQGVRHIAGDLEEVSASQFIGKDESQWPTSDDAFIFHDFVGRLLTDVKVNVARPGEYNDVPADAEATIAAETDLRSYVIYKSGNPTDTATNVTGSITFENEVIGIITDGTTAASFGSAIQATAPVFNPGINGGQWIDIHTFEEGFTISEDRRTLTFQFEVKKSTDTIRVLVKVE